MTGQTTPAERCKPAVKTYWLPLAVTLLVPMTSLIIYGTTLGNRLDAIAQDVEDNGEAISTTPSTFVPRRELDAKLENIELQVGAVQANVEALREQSERQTAEIIRKIERVADERRVVTP